MGPNDAHINLRLPSGLLQALDAWATALGATRSAVLRGTRVDAQDRREVERIAADKLANPSDLWLTTQLADLRDEDGELDSEKIGERVDQLVTDRPHWRKSNGPPPNFSSGVRQPIRRERTLGDAFKNALTGR